MIPEHAQLLAKLRTPHAYPDLVLAPSHQSGAYDRLAIDAPFLFEHEGRAHLLHIGFDGIGYRTGLALSDDLLHWHKEGLILDRGPQGSPTEFNVAMTWILRDNDLFGPSTLQRVGGRLLGTYHAYPAPGYEAGPAAIGLCWSDDLYHWDVEAPFLHAHDGASWERGGLYKSCLVHHEGVTYLFYNAKNRDHWPWLEQIGVAASTDLRRWTRHPANPILTVGPRGNWDDTFASDPCVLRVGDVWVMFYYGLCSADGHARNGVAFSHDLLHWEKSGEVLVDVGPEGAIDSRYAHKPGVLARDGVLYHYYCAVRPAAQGQPEPPEYGEIRGIGLRTSAPVCCSAAT